MISNSYKVINAIIVIFCLVLGCTGISSAAAAATDNTLSPYFFIENGQEGIDQMPLKSTKVEAKINAVIAQVKVIQEYVNEGARPIHARYVFPASTRAAVHGMRMQVGEQVIVARIEERKAAKQAYEAAKQQGKSASLLTEERANVFTMQVANIMPGDTIRLELDYTELLVPTDATYEFVYPTVVGPRYSTVPEKGAADNQQWIKNPYLKNDQPDSNAFEINVQISAGLPIDQMASPSHKMDVKWESDSRAEIQLKPSETNGGNRDFILRYQLAGEQIQSGLMLYEGDSENLFLMMLQPPERVSAQQVVPREYIFVVDVSGSMDGFPLNTSKVLLKDLITGLKPTDQFNVVLFAGAAEVLSHRSLPAEQGNLSKAVRMIDNQRGGGGTELYNALKTALRIPRSEGISRSIVIVTDGYIALEQEVFELIDANLNNTNFFTFGIGSSVNRYLIEGLAHIGQGEPFVVTDPDEAPAIAQRFRTYIEAPVLSNINIQYEDWDVYDLEPYKMPDLFAQRPLVVCGKWRGQLKGKINLSGDSAEGAYEQTIDLAHLKPLQSNGALPYLWARKRLSRLTDFNPQGEDDETRSQIVSLGLTYHLLTPHTAFVAVDETVRNPTGEGDDVDQPSPLPKGVSKLAVSGGHNVPEPGLVFMIALICLGILAGRIRRVIH